MSSYYGCILVYAIVLGTCFVLERRHAAAGRWFCASCDTVSDIDSFTHGNEPIVLGCIYPWRRHAGDATEAPPGWSYARPPQDGLTPGMFDDDPTLEALRAPNGKFFFEHVHGPERKKWQ